MIFGIFINDCRDIQILVKMEQNLQKVYIIRTYVYGISPYWFLKLKQAVFSVGNILRPKKQLAVSIHQSSVFDCISPHIRYIDYG